MSHRQGYACVRQICQNQIKRKWILYEKLILDYFLFVVARVVGADKAGCLLKWQCGVHTKQKRTHFNWIRRNDCVIICIQCAYWAPTDNRCRVFFNLLVYFVLFFPLLYCFRLCRQSISVVFMSVWVDTFVRAKINEISKKKK